MRAGIIEQAHNLRPYHGVHGKERTKKHDVIGMYVGIDEVELVVGVVFIEDVLSVVVVVEKRERHRRLRARKRRDVGSVDTVILQKLYYVLPHTVVTRLTDESGGHAGPRQRYDGVERRAAWISSNGLLFLEDDVENGLAYTYYFAHDCLCLY